MVYLIYEATFRTNGKRYSYVGHARSLPGQSDEEALRHRKRWHVSSPPMWMVGMNAASLSLGVVSRHRGKGFALSGEARAAARAIGAAPALARGGPWCRARLTAEARAEMSDVLGCATLAEVRNLKGSGALRAHLDDKGFDGRPWAPHPQKQSRRCQPSGCDKRQRKPAKYGDADWDAMKWGSTNPDAARKRAQDKYNNEVRPNRPRH